MNNNILNNHFNNQMEILKTNLDLKLKNAFELDKEIIVECIIQKVVAEGLPEYARTIKNKKSTFPDNSEMINFKNLRFHEGEGKITFSAHQFLNNYKEFIFHWLYCVFCIVKTFYNISKQHYSDVALVYGIGDESLFRNNSDEIFAQYCTEGPLKILRNTQYLFVKTTMQSDSEYSDHIVYCSNPLIHLFPSSGLSFLFRINVLMKFCYLFIVYHCLMIQNKELLLLSRDLPYNIIAKSLESKKIVSSIIHTCSNYTNQPLWMRGFRDIKTHMIWYAQAWKPIIYKEDKCESVLPNLLWIRCDKHWVWTKTFKNYLDQIYQKSEINHVGSIVWYLPIIEHKNTKKLKITIFDTSPFNDEIALTIGSVKNYNTLHNLKLFIKDLLDLKSEIEKKQNITVILNIKTKRGYNTKYSKNYFDYLETLNESNQMNYVDPGENIYKLISSSSVIIAYPFTSPAYIAEELEVPWFYYDPTNEIIYSDFSDHGSSDNFINNNKELIHKVISVRTI